MLMIFLDSLIRTMMIGFLGWIAWSVWAGDRQSDTPDHAEAMSVLSVLRKCV